MADRIKGPWSPEEDEQLRRLVVKYGPRNWTVISKYIPGRSGKSCRLRWCNQLSPQVEHRTSSSVTNGRRSLVFSTVRSVSDGGPPVANGLYMSPGSPTGSDVSDSSTIPVLPSVGLFRPVPRAGGPLPTETSSSSGDPATSLSLSLPGADVSEESTNINTLSRRQNKNAESFLPFSGGFRGAIEEMGKSFAGDGGEFMVLVQEMIKAEVRSYMAEMQRDRNGICGIMECFRLSKIGVGSRPVSMFKKAQCINNVK
ncbi:hypothetical protein BRARA_B03420 [Brassica rapa]|uniref:Uncharacterized protein n=1 Tax=Brassica campestris TaxID=3711 RepID=A0A398AF72_BRACM|nr:hypothetical protein BRARA_B03420 [Brassica rapa]